MAEKGAHLTGTNLIRPSIFEIIAQESFASTFESAFKKVYNFLVTCNVERYGSLVQWTDEGYLLFNAIIQRFYLNKYSASFSEVFYGLRRIPTIDKGIHSNLTKKQQKISLLLIVLIPYFKSKLTQISEKLKLQESNGQRWQKLFQNFIINTHTYGSMIYESAILYTYLLYASGISVYPTPILKLLSITLVYSRIDNNIGIEDVIRKVKNNSFNLNDGIDILQRSMTRSLELAAFSLQFLHWWNQENYHTSIMALPVPPPPEIPEIAQRYKGICPICSNKRKIHTALKVSGYVFCYHCILPIILKHKRCPVTNYPANEDDLVRLYV